MTLKKLKVDDSNYPAGSVTLSDPKTMLRVLTELKGSELAIVATLINAWMFKAVAYMGFVSTLAIVVLCIAALLEKYGQTGKQDNKEKNALGSDGGCSKPS